MNEIEPWRAPEHHARELAKAMAEWPEHMRFMITVTPHSADQHLSWLAMPNPNPVEELRQVVELYDRYEQAEKEFADGLDDDQERTPDELAIYEAWGDEVNQRLGDALHDLLGFRCHYSSTNKAKAEFLLGIYRRDQTLLQFDQVETLLESMIQ